MTYQVSLACEAMVRDKIIEACVDPALMRVRPTSNQQYIPEVFYKVPLPKPSTRTSTTLKFLKLQSQLSQWSTC
jgi:NPL4 family